MSTVLADPPVDAAPPVEQPTSRRFGVATLAMAVVAALLVGFAAGMFVQRPAPTPGETSAEAGFARDMITHHHQAVELGMIAYDRATLPGVRQLGYDIATAQQGEIGMMHQWLLDWNLLPTGSQPPMAWMPDGQAMAGSPMPGMASAEQMQELYEAEGTEVDRLFLELMYTHHLGGIHMIDGVLELAEHPDVLWLAGMMKDAQQKELTVLRDLQQQLAELEASSS